MARIPLGLEPVVGSAAPSKKREYRVTNRLQEGKRPLYAIAFNFIDSRYFDVFATVGGNRITIYRCLEGGVLSILQAYADEDKEESFYTLSWTCKVDGSPLLVAGGSNAVIRVIDIDNEKIDKSIMGHGDSVNEIRTQTLRPSLIASASKDESVRLWNIETGICVLIFAGAGGHRNEVLSVDFHPSDIYRIASCGMDNTVKIWSMKDFWTHVEASFTWTDLPSKFPTKYVQFPVFIASVHSNYVDCNRWLGDFVLSKKFYPLLSLSCLLIAIFYSWKLLKSGPQTENQRRRQRIQSSSSVQSISNISSNIDGCSTSADSDAQEIVDTFFNSVKPTLGQLIHRKLHGGRKVTCQLLGIILEEKKPEELQEHATVKSSVLEVLSEISKTCDLYLMERVLDDASEERVLSVLSDAGVFTSCGLEKEKVLFCGTEFGRASFVRQLEPDWHIDTNPDVIRQLARFIKYQLHVSPIKRLREMNNVFSAPALDLFFVPPEKTS